MATDRTTPEGVEAWLIQASANPWTFPAVVGPELSKEILQHIYVHWKTYSSNIKLGVLFAILCIRRLLVGGLKAELSAIITSGTYDKDEWVRLISKMLLEYPNSQTLDLNIEQYIPETAKKGLQELMSKIRENGIKFYPVEYAFVDREICDVFNSFSLWQATPTSHFTLRPGVISNNERQLKLTNLQVLPSPGLTSPINSSAFNFEPQNRGQSHSSAGLPVRSNTNPGPSLFIPKRRPSQLNQPYQRPSIPPQRPGSSNMPSMGSLNANPVIKPSELKISQRKTYQKPTRIQMIDISTGSSIIKNQEETRRQTQLEEQQQKELKKQERARKAEEKRREEDEKKQQREREKAEKARQKEEAKIAKEKERKDKAIRATSVEMQVSAGRKKKKLDEEEIIEEESISDGELPHKNPQVVSASPSSPPSMPKSPINIDQYDYDHGYSSSINGSVLETNENGPEVINSSVSEFNGDTSEFNEGVSEATSAAESSRQPTIPEDSSVPSEEPTNQVEISQQPYQEHPTREMSQKDRRLFERNCSAVLSQANKIDGDPGLRQCIINFLGGVHEVKALMAVSKGVKSPDDALRHIVLHEQTIRSPEGKAIRETFIFEMNIYNGQWRKIKRRKTKGFKNKKENEERNRMMMDEGNRIMMMEEEVNQENHEMMEERN